MEKSALFGLIHLDDHSATPKYQQLANSLITAVQSGRLRQDDVLPSINELSFEFEISRDTAEKGYKHLKKLGLLGSVPGKGYFIRSTDVARKVSVFLLFNKLSPHKKIIYDSLVATLGDTASVDFFIYNNDFSLFRKFIQQRRQDYTHYVIIPHFIEGGELAHEVINTIDKSRLILLDKLLPGISGMYGAVYEHFEEDIYQALEQALPAMGKYHTLKIIFPSQSYYPAEIQQGFVRFCQQYAFVHKIIDDIAVEPIAPGEVYLNLMDNDLVVLIERILAAGLTVGKDVGVISYNETPLKRIILNGITTISTDFEMMGRRAAELIRDNASDHVRIPFSLTLRSSL